MPRSRARPLERPVRAEYDDRMQRVTITVPDDVLDAVRERVAAGDAPNVSAYFAAAAETRTREGSLASLLADLEREHGPVDGETRLAVDAVLDRLDAEEPGPFDLRPFRRGS